MTTEGDKLPEIFGVLDAREDGDRFTDAESVAAATEDNPTDFNIAGFADDLLIWLGEQSRNGWRDFPGLTAAPPRIKGGERVAKPKKPTLAEALKEAAKAGQPVKGAVVEADRVTLTFGEPDEQSAVTPLEQWRAKRRGQG